MKKRITDEMVRDLNLTLELEKSPLRIRMINNVRCEVFLQNKRDIKHYSLELSEDFYKMIKNYFKRKGFDYISINKPNSHEPCGSFAI